MRSLITLITAAAFLLHFALGCCAHHAHAAEGAVCPGHSLAANHDHDGHNHDSQEPREKSLSDSECPSQNCDDGHCVFMADGKTIEVNDVFAVVAPLFAAALPSLGQISLLATVAIDSGGLIALPVRTHLFNQVLLI
jgi:hypothetical protein